MSEIQEETFTSAVAFLEQISDGKQVPFGYSWVRRGWVLRTENPESAENPALRGAAAGAALRPCPEGRNRCAEK